MLRQLLMRRSLPQRLGAIEDLGHHDRLPDSLRIAECLDQRMNRRSLGNDKQCSVDADVPPDRVANVTLDGRPDILDDQTVDVARFQRAGTKTADAVTNRGRRQMRL